MYVKGQVALTRAGGGGGQLSPLKSRIDFSTVEPGGYLWAGGPWG